VYAPGAQELRSRSCALLRLRRKHNGQQCFVTAIAKPLLVETGNNSQRSTSFATTTCGAM
jgi:hypothetical protein